ncbi:MAG TPA: hypothetical protein VMT53_15690 [Terriglobales bacterium]|nr:hypothetical protein [Terriglobales bacterium]
MKKLILALYLVGVCSFVLAQSPSSVEMMAGGVTTNKAEARHEAAMLAQQQAAQAEAHSPMATSSCAFSFTSGANDSFIKYCVTTNGNLAQLETPMGKEHIAIGTIGEGYGFCDLSSVIRYFDYSDFGDSGNWGAPTILNQTTNSVKIARTTTDGIWTLTQTITQVRGSTPAVKIAMTVKNNSGTIRSLFFMRYADVDAGGDFQNNFDGTQKSAFGWNSDVSSNPFGLILQNAGPFPADSSPGGFTQNVPQGPDPCGFAAHFAPGTQMATDGSIVFLYALNVPKGGSKTVTVSYQRM